MCVNTLFVLTETELQWYRDSTVRGNVYSGKEP